MQVNLEPTKAILELLPCFAAFSATFYRLFLGSQAPSTSVRDTAIWLAPITILPLFAAVYLIFHASIVGGSDDNDFTMFQWGGNARSRIFLARSILGATTITMPILIGCVNIDTDLKPLRDERGNLDSDAIGCWIAMGSVSFVGLLLSFFMLFTWLPASNDYSRLSKIRRMDNDAAVARKKR